MGSDGRGVRAISKSSIEISFSYNGKRCRERIPLPPTATNLKRAEQHRARILFEISQGAFDYAQVFPNSPRAAKYANNSDENTNNSDENTDSSDDIKKIGKYLETWLERKKKHIAASTYREYRLTVNNLLIPKFGKEDLSLLERQPIKDWLDVIDIDHASPLSNKRLSNIQSCLRSALTDAVNDGLISENPLSKWTYRRKEAPKDEDDIDPFTIEEQKAILAALTDQVRNLIQFAFWTGLRTSELIALNWKDIDFSRGYVKVRKAITTASKGKAEETKTRASRRDVKLLPPALAALNAQRQHTFFNENHAIFHNPHTQQRWTGDRPIRRAWTAAVARAEVKYRRPYQTRHTYASMMLSAGEHPMWVAKQMGHEDWTMIVRRYGRWMPSADENAGERAVAIFATKLLTEYAND